MTYENGISSGTLDAATAIQTKEERMEKTLNQLKGWLCSQERTDRRVLPWINLINKALGKPIKGKQ